MPADSALPPAAAADFVFFGADFFATAFFDAAFAAFFGADFFAAAFLAGDFFAAFFAFDAVLDAMT